jgi:hypothetical protein
VTDPVRNIDAIVAGHRKTLADIRRRVQAIDGRSCRSHDDEPRTVTPPRMGRIMQRVNDVELQAPPPAPEQTDGQRPRSWLT